MHASFATDLRGASWLHKSNIDSRKARKRTRSLRALVTPPITAASAESIVPYIQPYWECLQDKPAILETMPIVRRQLRVQ